jgi:hypothetical protein
LNGEYLHDDVEKAAEVEDRDDLGVGMLSMSLQTAIRDYIDCWIIVANTAQAVLDALPVGKP